MAKGGKKKAKSAFRGPKKIKNKGSKQKKAKIENKKNQKKPNKKPIGLKKQIGGKKSESVNKMPIAQTHQTHAKLSKIWKNELLIDADVRRWLIGTIGEHAIHIIQDFETPMSDEQIAQKTGVRASDVRIVLNKLHSYGLAIYTRSRDKNSGWYSYVWRFTDDHINEVMQQIKKGEGERTVISDGEGGEFYQCSACGSDKIFDFGHAVDLQFKCDRCGGDLKFVELKDAKKGED